MKPEWMDGNAIDFILKLTQVVFYISTVVIAFFTYRNAKKTLFSPVKTEIFKMQLVKIKDLYEFLLELETKMGVKQVFESSVELNYLILVHGYAEMKLNRVNNNFAKKILERSSGGRIYDINSGGWEILSPKWEENQDESKNKTYQNEKIEFYKTRNTEFSSKDRLYLTQIEYTLDHADLYGLTFSKLHMEVNEKILNYESEISLPLSIRRKLKLLKEKCNYIPGGFSFYNKILKTIYEKVNKFEELDISPGWVSNQLTERDMEKVEDFEKILKDILTQIEKIYQTPYLTEALDM